MLQLLPVESDNFDIDNGSVEHTDGRANEYHPERKSVEKGFFFFFGGEKG